MDDTKHIRITDTYVRSLVAEEAQRRGDKSATQTAAKLIAERMAQLEMMRFARQPAKPSRRDKAAGSS